MSDAFRTPLDTHAWRNTVVIVIGFVDVPYSVGAPSNTLFRPEHHWRCKKVPTADETRKYATKHGYYPSDKRGAHPAKCDPIYLRYEPEKANGKRTAAKRPRANRPVLDKQRRARARRRRHR